LSPVRFINNVNFLITLLHLGQNNIMYNKYFTIILYISIILFYKIFLDNNIKNIIIPANFTRYLSLSINQLKTGGA